MHFAARIIGPESVNDPLGYYVVNTANTPTPIECAVRAGIRKMVFTSTATSMAMHPRAPCARMTRWRRSRPIAGPSC